MPTPHIQAQKGEIAKSVIMPGDPLRAKFIAENFLENPKLINEVRNIPMSCLHTTMWRASSASGRRAHTAGN